MSTLPFHYRRINSGFIAELKRRVLEGVSAVLLGPRYGGKKYVMNRLQGELEKDGTTLPVRMDLLRQKSLSKKSELRQLIFDIVTKWGASVSSNAPTADGLFDAIDRLVSGSDRRVVILASYVDGMSHYLARHFLEEIQTRVKGNEIVTVLCGEYDFHHLVHGPKSDFNCAEQFVLQGFGFDEFRSQFAHYSAAYNAKFEDAEDAARLFWDRAGGNVHIMRLMIRSLLEARSRNANFSPSTFKSSNIPSSLGEIKLAGLSRYDVFRHPTRLIDRDPASWENLREMLETGTARLSGWPEDSPGTLELAGVAVREGAEFKPSSPMMRDFLKCYYDKQRFADLYARDGQWDQAFAWYGKLDPEERVRPSSTDDVLEVELTVKALSAALYSAAAKGVEDVKRLFANGCRNVLGFSEVSFWRRNGVWKSQPLDGFPFSQESGDAVSKILPLNGRFPPGPWPIPEHWNHYGLVAILPSLQPDQQAAVMISNFENRIVASREREKLAKDLLEHFVNAYSHAISVEAARGRLSVRNQHVELINLIFEGLGSDVVNPRHVLALAARGLRDMGYRRALFCLVDPERKRIQGVLDRSDDSSVNVAEMTDYPLDDPTKDLQPYVIYSRESKIVEDAALEPLANQEAVRNARMKSLAIVPILNPNGEAIGTIHIERADEAVPTKDEVEDLMFFGRQLAVAIEQSERVSLLQSALDKIPEPVVIVDRRERLRYVNKPGTDLLNVESGWQDHNDNNCLANQQWDEYFLRMLRGSLLTGHRTVHHRESSLSQLEFRREVLTDAIFGWQGKTPIGGLLHIRDMSYLHQILKAFGLVLEASDTNSALKALLEATKLLGFKWGRLYLIDESDPNHYRSKLSFGFKDPQRKENFDNGLINLPARHTPGIESWLSIEQSTPLVFYYTRTLPDRKVYVTPYGLEAIVVNHPQLREELEKEPEEFWLDIPLGTKEKALGKMTLDCDKNLLPEDFEIMKLLIGVSSRILYAHTKRDRETSEKMQMMEKATAEKIMASLAHNLSTRFASLPILLAQYCSREAEAPGIKKLNDKFQDILTDISTTITRAKERLVAFAIKPTEVDLVANIERTLRLTLSDKVWSLECDRRPLNALVDSHLLETALLELIQNSRDMIEAPDQLRITINLEGERIDPKDWVRITYKDNGPGVPEEFKKRIFEDFFTRRPGRKTGTGLGLAFVRRVVEAHGGVIVEAGEFGQGAEFRIGFPARPAPDQIKENGHVSHLDR